MPNSSYSNLMEVIWTLEIPLAGRTIWYRSIHNKIPTKNILHRLIPSTHPSPNCLLCSPPTAESEEHFLFLCPLKHKVRSSIIQSYINPAGTPLSNSALFQVKLSLSLLDNFERHHSITLLPQLSVYQIFACTLLGIWRFIFDNVPFVTHKVLSSIHFQLGRLKSEIQLGDE